MLLHVGGEHPLHLLPHLLLPVVGLLGQGAAGAIDHGIFQGVGGQPVQHLLGHLIDGDRRAIGLIQAQQCPQNPLHLLGGIG